MRSYTFSEARQKFAAVLDQAHKDGAVRINRRDGKSYVLTPETQDRSPLNIPGIELAKPVSRDEIVKWVRKGRRRTR